MRTPLEQDMLAIEHRLWQSGIQILAGVDEAGRGPLAGPVVAAAVVFHPYQRRLPDIDDSKRLSLRQREQALATIHHHAWAIGIGSASETEIDQLDIRCATLLAMKRAIAALGIKVEYCLYDGKDMPDTEIGGEAIVKGDQRSMSIAAASIVAKVTRDRIMISYDALFPQYGFAQHKGYPTSAHLTALKRYGPCPIHRRSFHPKQLQQ